MPGAEPQGYFVAVTSISEAPLFEQCRAEFARLREAYEGQTLVCAYPMVSPSGKPVGPRVTIVQYATVSNLRKMLADPEYAALHAKICQIAPGQAWAAQGVTPPPEAFPPGDAPRAYAISRFRIGQPERYEKFKDLWARLVAAHGGRFLVRLEVPRTSAGEHDEKYLSISEYPSLRQLKTALASPDYQDADAINDGRIDRTLWIAEGGGCSTGG